uniref:alpha-1,6-mannosyl-glycoprotein 6-beta-N-acetylglucosaminyltransferase n=1 Tax=Fundulus heteroclitus TaxID=8078 RepID=A0A3Q2NQI3_FUNHE
VPTDPAYPLCAEKVEFLRARWQSDPCYAFYGVDGSTCSILVYLSQIEDFCPAEPGRNHTAVPWHHKTASYTEKVFSLPSCSSAAVKFIRSRVERMSERWIWAGRRMKTSRNHTATPQMKVLLYLGALAGSVGHRFEAMVDRGGPLGELVQWADLSACLTVLGHNLSFSTSHLIGAAPGQGSCPIQRPLTFDLIYTDYHGLAHLHRAMGLAFQHYQCRFRILDSFGTEPAFNLASYAHIGGYETLWGSWGLQPLQYMTMFPHTPDNSFLGFVSEEAAKTGMRQTRLQPGSSQKDGIAVGKSEYVEMISKDLEIHGTVYQPPGHTSTLPSFVKNHRLLSQENFLQLLRRAKVFVGLGFPYEGPAPVEAIALGCMFLQPRFDPPHSSLNNDFYKGKPTTRQITSQHPYAEQFIAKPYVWTVDMTNRTDIREAVKSILKTKVRASCTTSGSGLLHRGNLIIKNVSYFPRDARRHVDLSSVALVLFGRLGLGCSSTAQEVNHLFPAYSPWGRLCGLQREPRLFSCAGADSAHLEARLQTACGQDCERSQGK